jgi:hypothetical protein
MKLWNKFMGRITVLPEGKRRNENEEKLAREMMDLNKELARDLSSREDSDGAGSGSHHLDNRYAATSLVMEREKVERVERVAVLPPKLSVVSSRNSPLTREKLAALRSLSARNLSS